MAKKLDQILVIDLESTCWKGPPPEGQESEIIEIGLCMLDVANGERLDNASIIVRPVTSKVSDYCTQLTTLSQAEVEAGLSLRRACEILRDEYHSKQRLWASYGDYDRWQFERCCAAQDVEYPFGTGHINVKSLLAVTRAMSREVGLDKAMNLFGWPLEGTHHRGGDDAWNIARILGHILLSARHSDSRSRT